MNLSHELCNEPDRFGILIRPVLGFATRKLKIDGLYDVFIVSHPPPTLLIIVFSFKFIDGFAYNSRV